ncbi:Serine/threonine-protein kinase EDR1 [Linum perenne]
MDTPPTEELLRKIQELEAGQVELQQEMTRLRLSSDPKSEDLLQQQQQHHHHHHHHHHPRSQSISPQRQGTRRTLETSSTMKKTSPPFRHSSPLQRESRHPANASNRSNVGGGGGDGGSGSTAGPPAIKFTDRQYLNILQSMGQAIHIFDNSGYLIYWNRTAENLFGYSSEEALGQLGIDLMVDPRDRGVAHDIVSRNKMGEKWTGRFPVRSKRGDRFTIAATNTPFYDDDGTLIGVICVSNDARAFQEVGAESSDPRHSEPESATSRARTTVTTKLGLDPQQPLQVAIASKISNLATKMSNKVKSKIRAGDNNIDHEGGSGDSHHSDHGFSDAAMNDHREDVNSSGASTPRAGTPRGEFYPSPFLLSHTEDKSRYPGHPGDDSEGKPAIHKIISSKAEAWMGKKGLSWPWKGNERDVIEVRTPKFVWPWLQNDHENDTNHLKSPFYATKIESHSGEGHRHTSNELGSWSSANVNSTSSVSSSGSTSSSAVNRVDLESDCLDYEILWEDLTIGEQIGQGSCGTVYHALWYGSDVAVKVFSKQEYSEDVIFSFRQEVSLMKRLRHPNVLLFMGAVTSPQRLCIVTEFLPREHAYDFFGFNVFSQTKILSFCAIVQWKFVPVTPKEHNQNRLETESAHGNGYHELFSNSQSAVISPTPQARGMNYLHHYNPPIIHRDLKSSNLLVDKNWTVKVGDFGLSRLKHETYLTTKTGKGTPQWMAPEVLRNEPSDEKSDIYSFGVILWEIATEKIPWDTLNSMQVIGAVGFMNQRLEIPKDVDPRWSSIIESCWLSDPSSRPSFQELLDKLRDLQRQYTIQLQAARSSAAGGGDNTATATTTTRKESIKHEEE